VWITDFRQRAYMTELDLARAVTILGAREEPAPIWCSETTIHALEVVKGYITHPKIADLIATVCRATPEQRDMIVHEKHRGKWKGPGSLKRGDLIRQRYALPPSPEGKAEGEPKPHAWRDNPSATSVKAKRKKIDDCHRPIVAVDAVGRVVARYDQARVAAYKNGYSRTSIIARCNRRVFAEFNNGIERTFRFADEWDEMTPEARYAEISTVAARESTKAHTNGQGKPVVVVDKYGHERGRYRSVFSAASANYVEASFVHNRCRRIVKREFESEGEITFRYAEEWDQMSHTEQLADLKGVKLHESV